MPRSENKILYVSDLDGTLLNEKSQISSLTARTLNKLIDNGVNFTIATARTPATVVGLMKDVKLNKPVVLMTGALIYDMAADKYLSVSSFDENVSQRLIEVISSLGASPMIYYVDDELLHVAYRRPISNRQRFFINQRKGTPYKKYVEVKGALSAPKGTVLIFFMDAYERLEKIHRAISDIDGHCSYLYCDSLLPEQGYLEIYPSGTSKANAIKRMAAELGITDIVAFGDNLNDIPMFDIAYRAYAVDNAVEEVKNYATDIIASNVDNGVARFIAEEYGLDVNRDL